MRTFRFDKLVRDKIVASQQEEGSISDYRILTDDEYVQELLKKLAEEGAEIDPKAPRDELLSELADLQEVIDCLLVAIKSSKSELTERQQKKNKKAGSFGRRMYIHTVTIDENNPWVRHYRENPDRYPEVKT